MGKPYALELNKLPRTYAAIIQAAEKESHSFVQDIVGKPLVAVGSGGSFSAAVFAATLHERLARQPAKAMTPFELRDLPGNNYDNRLQPEHIPLMKKCPKLEIQTMAAEGLRFRWRGGEQRANWRRLPATKVKSFKDAAGAGDWCSAGIIHILAKSGHTGFARGNDGRLLHALRFGQQLAALNCAYEGARGAMYHVAPDEITRILKGGRT